MRVVYARGEGAGTSGSGLLMNIARKFCTEQRANRALRLGLGLSVLAFGLSPHRALAETTVERSCDGGYQLSFTRINGEKPAKSSLMEFGKFGARRGCGKSVPNRCRERAREAILTCGERHWGRLTEGDAPAQCSGDEGIRNYSVASMQLEVERVACCATKTSFDSVQVSVRVYSRGIEACTNGGPGRPSDFQVTRSLSDNYPIDCKKVRAAKPCSAR